MQKSTIKLQLTTPKGQSFYLSVTEPQGLTNVDSDNSDFVIKIVSMDSVMKIYEQRFQSDLMKVGILVAQFSSGSDQEEIPLLETIGDDEFDIRTDAYVVEALRLLGFTHIPVMVRGTDAHLIR
jgi:hypothetical protein